MVDYEKKPISECRFDFLDSDKFEYFREVVPDMILALIPLIYLEVSCSFNERTAFQAFLEKTDSLMVGTIEYDIQTEIRAKLNQIASEQLRMDDLLQQDLGYFEALGEKIYDEASEKYTGNALYDIFAKNLRANFMVIQMLNPQLVVPFNHDSIYPTLYVLETDGTFLLLYPKSQYYKRVWNDELESSIILDNLSIIENKEMVGDFTQDSMKGQDLTKYAEEYSMKRSVDFSGHMIEDSIKRSEDFGGQMIKDSMKRSVDFSGQMIEDSIKRSEDFGGHMIEDPRNHINEDPRNHSNEDPKNHMIEDPRNHINEESKEELTSSIDRILENIHQSLYTLKDYKEIMWNNIQNLMEIKKNSLIEAQEKLKRAKALIKGKKPVPGHLLQFMSDIPENVSAYFNRYSEEPLTVNEEKFDSLIELTLPEELIGSIELPDGRVSECALCLAESSLFEYSCKCKICEECILSQEDKAKMYCLNCGQHSNHSYHFINDFIKKAKENKLNKLREMAHLCMNCRKEFDSNLMITLQCECRLCFDCIFEENFNCRVCNRVIYHEEREIIRKFIQTVAYSEICKECNSKKLLVCECMCEECAYPVMKAAYMPLLEKCPKCRQDYPRELLVKFLRRLHYCPNCKGRYSYDEFFHAPCNCKICYKCLKEQSAIGISNCKICRQFYTEHDRKFIYRDLERIFSDIKPYEPHCLSNSHYREDLRESSRSSVRNIYPNNQDLSISIHQRTCHHCHELTRIHCQKCSICENCLRKTFPDSELVPCPLCSEEHSIINRY